MLYVERKNKKKLKANTFAISARIIYVYYMLNYVFVMIMR